MGQTQYHQKAESLKAIYLWNLDNMVNNISTLNTKYPEFSAQW